MPEFITEYPQFFTASIKGYHKLLEEDKYKDIIVSSLKYLVEDKRIKLYSFVIMSDHIHLIWQMQPLIPAYRQAGIHWNHVKNSICKLPPRL